MLGFLLARAGVKVAVLEKHEDFFRDFRGDTIHPSTLQVMHELGLLEAFLKLPHQQVERLGAEIGGQMVQIADFSHLPTAAKFIALMPQWDFLDFLAAQGKRYPGFDLHMAADVDELISEGGKVAGLKAATHHWRSEVRVPISRRRAGGTRRCGLSRGCRWRISRADGCAVDASVAASEDR
ncbi:MAG: hypothetical protein A49_29330 [Methyloceanibacter sp.]|nr:MAG: hypothetical protein A49_29330 [Methyloceanibacter sp.]